MGSEMCIRDSFKTDAIGNAGVVHNEYLRVLYEQGFVGVTWFVISLVGSAIFLGAKLRGSSGEARMLFAAALVAVLVYMAISLTDNPLDYYQLLGQYVVLLAAMALGVEAREAEDGPDQVEAATADAEPVAGDRRSPATSPLRLRP